MSPTRRKQVTYKSAGTHQRNQGLDDIITIIPSKSRTSNKTTLTSNGNHNHRSTRRIQSWGPPVNPITQTCVASTQKTRRIKRALTRKFDNHAQTNTKENHEPENHKQNEGNLLLQLDPNLLTSIPTSDNPTGEQDRPLFSAIALKQKRRMLFAPIYFQQFSIDALIDFGALVNCMPESELQKLKNMSPDNILQETDPPPFKLQVANGEIESPTKTIQVQFEIGDWTFKETYRGEQDHRPYPRPFLPKEQ